MQVTLEDKGPCRKLMHVTAPAESTKEDYEEVLRAYVASGKVPGFRPGKAPSGVVERHYARHIGEDVKQRLLPRLYREATQQAKLTPVAVIDVDGVQFGKAEGISFHVVVDVAPEFKLPRYKKMTLKSARKDVAESDVDDAVLHLRESAAQYADVTDRPVRDGDLVQLDYAGTCEGKPVGELAPDCSNLGEGTDFWARVGEPEFLPGFREGLQGAELGGEKEIAVRFPGDYHVAAVAGREATYTFSVKGIRERVLPEIDEAFLKRFGAAEESELRERIREDLVQTEEREEEGRLNEQIAQYLLSKTKFDLPQAVVEDETRVMVRNIVRRTVMQGATREQIEAQRDDILNAATKSSVDRVRMSYILSRIADAENVAVDPEEVEERIRVMAMQYRTTPEQLKEQLAENNGLQSLESDIRAEKTLGWIRQFAKIK